MQGNVDWSPAEGRSRKDTDSKGTNDLVAAGAAGCAIHGLNVDGALVSQQPFGLADEIE